MVIPNETHAARPWRIHELIPDFRLEDVWALPTPGGPDDFPLLVEGFVSSDPGEHGRSPSGSCGRCAGSSASSSAGTTRRPASARASRRCATACRPTCATRRRVRTPSGSRSSRSTCSRTSGRRRSPTRRCTACSTSAGSPTTTSRRLARRDGGLRQAQRPARPGLHGGDPALPAPDRLPADARADRAGVARGDRPGARLTGDARTPRSPTGTTTEPRRRRASTVDTTMGEQLSMLDTMFLELEQADVTAHMHIGGVLVFDPLPGGGTPTSARCAAARAPLGVLPRYRQRLSSRTTGGQLARPGSRTSASTSTAHVTHATLPAPGGEAELLDWLGDFWSHRLDRHRPLWGIVLLDGLQAGAGRWPPRPTTASSTASARSTSGTCCSTPTPDAAAAGRPLPAGRGTRTAERPATGASGSPRASSSRGARAGLGAARHPRQTLHDVRAARRAASCAKSSSAAPETSLNGRAQRAPASSPSCASTSTRSRRSRHAHGGTVNDVVLASARAGCASCCSCAARRRPRRACARRCRSTSAPDEQAHALGNELTSLFVELPVDEPEPGARYRRVRGAAQSSRPGTQSAGGKTIVDVADMGPPLPAPLVARSMFGGTRMFNLTITNVPGPQSRCTRSARRCAGSIPLVPLSAEHAVGIAVVSYDGRSSSASTPTGRRARSSWSSRGSSARWPSCARSPRRLRRVTAVSRPWRRSHPRAPR